MAHVTFCEKPGCEGNARQKALLAAAGPTLDVRDLLAHPWTAEELGRFLAGVPVADWFNRTAPRVKAKKVVPEALTAEAARAILLDDPLLIRRPLLQVGDRREVGFLSAVVDAWIGLEPVAASHCGGLEGCSSAAPGGCSIPAPSAPVVMLGRGRAGG